MLAYRDFPEASLLLAGVVHSKLAEAGPGAVHVDPSVNTAHLTPVFLFYVTVVSLMSVLSSFPSRPQAGNHFSPFHFRFQDGREPKILNPGS